MLHAPYFTKLNFDCSWATPDWSDNEVPTCNHKSLSLAAGRSESPLLPTAWQWCFGISFWALSSFIGCYICRWATIRAMKSEITLWGRGWFLVGLTVLSVCSHTAELHPSPVFSYATLPSSLPSTPDPSLLSLSIPDPFLFPVIHAICLFLGYILASWETYLSNASSQITACAATPRQKLQIKLSNSFTV